METKKHKKHKYKKNHKALKRYAANNQKKPEKIRTSIAGSSSAKKPRKKQPEPNQNMIRNMQKFWRDYKVKNLVPQNNSDGVGDDLKPKPPDNSGSSAPVSLKQRTRSRKDLARDGSTSSGEKAKILAQRSSNVNDDKTWRDSEGLASIIPPVEK